MRLLSGREVGQAEELRGSQPDGEVALAAATKYPEVDGRTDGQADDGGGGREASRVTERARLKELAGQAQRRPLCRSAE